MVFLQLAIFVKEAVRLSSLVIDDLRLRSGSACPGSDQQLPAQDTGFLSQALDQDDYTPLPPAIKLTSSMNRLLGQSDPTFSFDTHRAVSLQNSNLRKHKHDHFRSL